MRKQLGVLLLAMAASAAGLAAQGATSKPSDIFVSVAFSGGRKKAFTLKDNRSGVSYRTR